MCTTDKRIGPPAALSETEVTVYWHKPSMASCWKVRRMSEPSLLPKPVRWIIRTKIICRLRIDPALGAEGAAVAERAGREHCGDALRFADDAPAQSPAVAGREAGGKSPV